MDDVIIFDPFGELLKLAEEIEKEKKEKGDEVTTWPVNTSESKA